MGEDLKKQYIVGYINDGKIHLSNSKPTTLDQANWQVKLKHSKKWTVFKLVECEG